MQPLMLSVATVLALLTIQNPLLSAPHMHSFSHEFGISENDTVRQTTRYDSSYHFTKDEKDALIEKGSFKGQTISFTSTAELDYEKKTSLIYNSKVAKSKNGTNDYLLWTRSVAGPEYIVNSGFKADIMWNP